MARGIASGVKQAWQSEQQCYDCCTAGTAWANLGWSSGSAACLRRSQPPTAQHAPCCAVLCRAALHQATKAACSRCATRALCCPGAVLGYTGGSCWSGAVAAPAAARRASALRVASAASSWVMPLPAGVVGGGGRWRIENPSWVAMYVQQQQLPAGTCRSPGGGGAGGRMSRRSMRSHMGPLLLKRACRKAGPGAHHASQTCRAFRCSYDAAAAAPRRPAQPRLSLGVVLSLRQSQPSPAQPSLAPAQTTQPSQCQPSLSQPCPPQLKADSTAIQAHLLH